jgi:hypothetical protein
MIFPIFQLTVQEAVMAGRQEYIAGADFYYEWIVVDLFPSSEIIDLGNIVCDLSPDCGVVTCENEIDLGVVTV